MYQRYVEKKEKLVGKLSKDWCKRIKKQQVEKDHREHL